MTVLTCALLGLLLALAFIIGELACRNVRFSVRAMLAEIARDEATSRVAALEAEVARIRAEVAEVSNQTWGELWAAAGLKLVPKDGGELPVFGDDILAAAPVLFGAALAKRGEG